MNQRIQIINDFAVVSVICTQPRIELWSDRLIRFIYKNIVKLSSTFKTPSVDLFSMLALVLIIIHFCETIRWRKEICSIKENLLIIRNGRDFFMTSYKVAVGKIDTRMFQYTVIWNSSNKHRMWNLKTI